MCGQNKIAAIILAAGYSSRMGDFKPLMKLNGITVIESAVGCFRRAGISDITVVVGHRAPEIIAILDTLNVDYILNEHYEQGMFSSIKKGVSVIADSAAGFFLLPGDMPLVKHMTIERITEEAGSTDYGIIYPCFLGKRGHPPFISAKYYDEILHSDTSYNLRSLLSTYEFDSIDLEVFDQAILMDIDTPEDFNNTRNYLNHQNAPSADECAAIFLKYKTSAKIVKHGEAVSEVACRIANLLNDTGRVSLDLSLIIAGSLLHDIARDKPYHANEGAMILKQLGYHEVAEIIAGHMELDTFSENPVIDERAVVYLADKLIKEDMIISLHERFAESLESYSMDPSAMANIRQRELKALSVKESVERICGLIDLEAILQKDKILQ